MRGLISLLSGLSVMLLVVSGVGASEYNSLLIRAQVSIFPKIIMLDESVADKLVDNAIALHLVYRPEDKKGAERVRQLIEAHYGDKIGQYKLKVTLVGASSKDHKLATAYYLLNVGASALSDITDLASKNKRIAFSYNHKQLENDALISLQLREKVYIYLSKKQLSKYDIRFQSVFYNIVKVIE